MKEVSVSTCMKECYSTCYHNNDYFNIFFFRLVPNFIPHTSVSASLVEAMLSLNTTVNVSYGGFTLMHTHSIAL